ncbi:hypothetical protein [Streptosporangium sp. NPDC051022]|uniref:hypothetical protein n=1 Tax=Streptosporangium sp. NPDC051022 TaxID=3155752 RepID=UPI0034142657
MSGEHNIAMWGAPGSGKTTFLAALNIAAMQRQSMWSVIGADAASTDFLVRMTETLAAQRRFPQATVGMERYRWFLLSEEDGRRGRLFRRPARRQVAIGLDLLDPSGEVYSSGRSAYRSREELVDVLARSRGIVYLFDPIREAEEGDAFDHLHGVLIQLCQRMLSAGRFSDGVLPHHVAVCVAKFDDRRILETALRLRLLTIDPEDPLRFPRVDDEDAAELFRTLCEVSVDGSGKMVASAFERYFHPDRIKYFVTSAIGFHVDPGRGVYDDDDSENLLPESGVSGFRIRGAVRPINIMEPLLWLGRRLSSGSRD